jgi:hypothetical protein
MTRFIAMLLAACALALAAGRADAATIEWTLIDVKARLDNEGRLHVVETHTMRVEKGGFFLFREFGLGADQAIAFRALVRLDPDGSEHPLRDADVDGPDAFRYYPRGHAHFQLPELGAGAEIAYRFEYELLNAVSPAWAIAAGPDALIEDDRIVSPWQRLRAIVADWREARPDPEKRYRLDHDVLLPSREGPAYEVRQIDYRLAFDDAWKQVHPEAELATVQADSSYRVRPLFEYLREGRPAAASWRQALERCGSLVALPILGLVLWLGLLTREAFTMRSLGPVDRAVIVEHLLSLAPEQVRGWVEGTPVKPTAEDVLTRLASERKLAVELDPAKDADEEREVHMRLLAPLASFAGPERELVRSLFPKGGNETSSAQLREFYAERGLDLEVALGAAPVAMLPAPPRRWLGALPWLGLGALGLILQLRALPRTDYVAMLIFANAVAALLVAAWPRAWWHGTLPRRGLLIPLFGLIAVFLAVHLSVNRPLPAQVWVGTGLAALAGFAIVLGGSRMPAGGPYQQVRQLGVIRRFALNELRRPYPRLEDGWLPHLRALGLAGAIEAWQRRHGGVASRAPDLSSEGASDALAGPRFTGLPRASVGLPEGWTDGLWVDPGEDDVEDERDADAESA